MPKKKLIRSKHLPYHVVNRTNHREWFNIPIEKAWSEFQFFCWEANLLYGAKIHAFVLMSNHFHLIVSTPENDLGEVMRLFSSGVARSINYKSHQQGHVFGGRYKWSLISHPEYYLHALKYVYRNPVKANLVSRVEDYKYSSLHGLLGKSHLLFPTISEVKNLDLKIEIFQPETLNWLNTSAPVEDELALRTALVRSVFKLPRDRVSRESHALQAIPKGVFISEIAAV
jgi:putative transposase